MYRSTPRIPGLGVAVSALLTAGLLLAAGASTVLAGDTRLIDIGSDVDCATLVPAAEPNGTLDLTEVSPGQLTHFGLAAKNCGSQNLSNVIMTVGHAPASTWDQLSDPFSDGTTIFEVYGANADACSTNTAKTLLTCTFKSLRAGSDVGISVVLRAPTSGAGVTVYAAIKAAENTNDGGANEDTFEATGTELFAAGSSCDLVATFYAPSSRDATTCALGAPGDTNAQQSSVRYVNAKNLPVKIREETTGTETCGGTTRKSPVGADVRADIDGDEATDTVRWTVVIDLKAIGKGNVKTSDLVICHWNDTGSFTPAVITSASKSKQGILTVTFTTQGNGKARIYS